MTRPLLEARGIVKSFASRKRKDNVLPGVNLTLGAGEILAVTGPSGCGKSTLLNILAGFTKADAGSVLLDGQPCRAPGPDRAVVFQEDALFPWLTALENVTLGLRSAGGNKAENHVLAKRMLARVGLSGFESHLPKAISGGMRQRLALARILALCPRVLLMDEPFAALDAITREQMHDLLIELHHAMGMSILMVTHDVSEAVLLADTILIMGKAGQGVRHSFAVPMPRPRSQTAPEYVSLQKNIHDILRAQFAPPLTPHFSQTNS